MKKMVWALSLCAAFAVTGCAGKQAPVSAIPGQNVFREIKGDTPPESGYVDLKILSSVKTHKPGVHAATDTHGTADYRMVVSIDGQATTVEARMNPEKSDPRSIRDPEEGEGIRYDFATKVRLKAGEHRVSVTLPAEGIVAERELFLPKERNQDLVIEPLYRSIPGTQGPGYVKKSSFREGIKALVLVLNGASI